MRNRASIRQWIGGVLNRVPAPFLVFLGGGTGALCRVYTPGGVLVANLLGSFTLGLLTMVWNAYARRDGEERIHSFRLLFWCRHDGWLYDIFVDCAGFGADDFFCRTPSTTRT